MDTPQNSSDITMVGRRLTDSAQHTKRKSRREYPYYFEAKKPSRLKKSWGIVYQNGIASPCEKTRREVRLFTYGVDAKLDNIYRSLHRENWKFEPQVGVLKKRPQRTPRPIVISPIPNRIVQRSILDVLQEEPSLQPFFRIGTSFGGIKDRGVKQAISTIFNAIRGGAAFYIRSDIENFFANIRKEVVITTIASIIPDPKFIELLSKAIEVELINIAKLKGHSDAFPSHIIGVAQGCCLSPLLGNIYLHDFDVQMNESSITCLRYIDDFIILGPSQESVSQAFKKAAAILKINGLRAYSPFTESAKADIGSVENTFTFLGCDMRPYTVSPARKSRKRLLDTVEMELTNSLLSMGEPGEIWKRREALADTLVSLSNIIQGWGNHYSFCSNRGIFQEMDRKIDERLDDYLRRFRLMYSNASEKDRRRLLGIHLLEDCNSDPIC